MITKRNGNGLTECFGCKEKGKFALEWDSLLYDFNDEPYCFDCLLEKLEKFNEENEKLKKQLEEKHALVKQCEISVTNVMDCYCERTDCASRIKDGKKYDSLIQKIENQQQEFIKYLKSINSFETIGNILSKYKEIIGVKNDNTR